MTVYEQLQSVVLPVSPFRQNATLLFDIKSKKGVLIDPGAELPRIFAAIAKHGVKIEAIWLTHGHIDHTAAAMAAAKALNVPIYGPQKFDKVLMDRLEETAAYYQWQDIVDNCKPDYWLEEGDEVFCGGHKFTVLHTPGHAPGHISYFCREAKLALVGDVLFRGAIGRTDLPTSDHAALLASIKDKLLPLGDDVTFICGHGRSSTFGYEKQTNPFLRGL